METRTTEVLYTDTNGYEREPTPEELTKNPNTYGSDGNPHKLRRQRISYWNVIYIVIFGPLGFFSVSIVLGVVLFIIASMLIGTNAEISLSTDPNWLFAFYLFMQIVLLPVFFLYVYANNALVESRRIRVARRSIVNAQKKVAPERVDTAQIKAETKAEILRRTASVADSTDQLVGRSLAFVLKKIKK